MKMYKGIGFCLLALAICAMAIPVQAEGLKEINISYVKSPFNLQIMVIKEKMLLEKEFAKDGIKVNWHTITSGAKQAQAMAAGSLDLASVINSTSVLLANAAGNKVRIVGGVSRPAKTFAIVAGKNGPRAIEELKGKTIAGPKGTVLHQMLVAALESKGLKESDVKMLSMGLPKARTAMLGGQVDAALLAASLVIKSEEAGAHVVATADGLVSPKLVVGARDEFAQEHPDMIVRYLKVQREAMDFIANNQKEAIAIGAKEQGISIKDATILFSQSGYTNAITVGDVESMREDLAFLHKNNMVKKPINPAEACLPVAFME